MGCCGKHKRREPTTIAAESAERKGRPSDYFIGPAGGCVLCAEKHISTAYALACEVGYETPNRQRIVGELTAAALHLYRDHREIAEKARALRHLIQQRREGEVGWAEVLADVDRLAAAEVLEMSKEETK